MSPRRPEAPQQPVPGDLPPSPCVQRCRIDPQSAWCEGCLRTLDEIAAWSSLDAAGRAEVWRQIGLRRRARLSE